MTEQPSGQCPHLNAKSAEKIQHVRVCLPVENDEASVHGGRLFRILSARHVDRVSVPADIVPLLVNSHMVLAVEHPRGAKARDPAPYNRDLQLVRFRGSVARRVPFSASQSYYQCQSLHNKYDHASRCSNTVAALVVVEAAQNAVATPRLCCRAFSSNATFQ